MAAPEGEERTLMDVKVFRDTGTLGVLVGSTTVEFAWVVNLIMVLLLLLLLWTRLDREEVL